MKMQNNKNYQQTKEFLIYLEKQLVFQNSKGHKSFQELLSNYSGPLFIYDLDLIADRIDKMKSALKNVKLFYAMKANHNQQILKLLLQKGLGADVVSLGEINQALRVGFKPQNIVYSGVGKTKQELQQALELNIYQINVESLPELERILGIAKQNINLKNKKIRVAFRLNPNISIETHPYIATGLRDNKFGIDLDSFDDLLKICLENKHHLSVQGISLHLGSQMMEFAPLKDSLAKLKKYFSILNQHFPECHCFDVGGGLGVFYQKQDLVQEDQLLQEYAKTLFSELEELKHLIPNFEIQSEPGRWLVAHGGVLVSQVQYVKKTPYKEFIILDTGMNHLARPSLYEAYHEILPHKISLPPKQVFNYEVVGPICESSDFIGKNRNLTEVQQDDFMVIADCGAYGASMSNDYNLQPRAKEICI
jgi:diaminopimelate decarboxylase